MPANTFLDRWMVFALAGSLAAGANAATPNNSGASMSAPQTRALARPVRLDSGLVSGVSGRDPAVQVFKGIPYAAPPVGHLRWRAPQPVRPWKGVRKADSFGPVCPQHLRPNQGSTTPMSEDCLTVNVWTAAISNRERRPVYVWFYGGGFNEGAGSDPQFDGEALARKGVIVVTFNYRLGPLGFLATPELSAESGHNASGNYGLLDDIALLKWVQRNIAAFGGDPTKVTVGGQSAGAGTVGFMAVSPLARGLLRAGIAESQVRYPQDPELRYLNTSTRRLPAAEEAGAAYVESHAGTRSLAKLRQVPWQQLMEGSTARDENVQTGTDARPPLFRPVVDGWVVPQTYSATLSKGLQNPIVYVAGNNLDESGAAPETGFAALRAHPPEMRAGMPHYSVTLADYEAWAKQKFGPVADEFMKLYPASDDDSAARAHNDAVRDNSRVSTWLWAREWKKTVHKPVYTYFWTHALVGPTRETRGAFHGSELMYVFDSLDANPDLPWTAEDRRIADVMSSYWANIIKTGNPNGPGLPEWPAYRRETLQVMQVGDDFGPMPVTTPDKLDFWERYFATQDAW